MSVRDAEARLQGLTDVLRRAPEAEAWEALRETLSLLGPWLLKRVSQDFRIRGEDAEDLLSEATLRVFENRARIQSSLAGYFWSVTRHAALDRLSAAHHELPLLHEDHPESVGEPMPSKGTPALVARLLADLHPHDRRILHAFARAEDDSCWTEAIARELGLTQNAVRVRKNRALDRVRRALKHPPLPRDGGDGEGRS